MVRQCDHPVTWLTLLKVIARSFWLQSCWNFQGMQNLGFGFAIIPVIKTLYIGKAERIKAIKRHLEFFNTHPYCAAIILGVVAQLEEAACHNKMVDAQQISRIKSGMMGPLAALGDTVYWATLKPALALCAVALVFTAARNIFWQSLTGVFLFVVFYNIPHLALRVGGVFVGYTRGINIVQDLRRFNPQLIARRLSFFLAIVTGALLVAYPALVDTQSLMNKLMTIVIFFTVTAIMVVFIKKKITVAVLIYSVILLSLLLALTGWVSLENITI